jgi:integrase
VVAVGNYVAAILKTLPSSGELFPTLARIHERHRAKMFIKRLKTIGVSGVSLHSYRYAWAERAKEAGYPERFAMQALGHSSKAVHRAHANKAQVVLPPLEDYEKRARKESIAAPRQKPACPGQINFSGMIFNNRGEVARCLVLA